jgi:energy-coupling factor transport system ATP-binding protein
MSQLDDAGAAALVGTLRALADAGTTVVVAEHRLAGLSDARRVSLLEGRRIRADEPARPAGRTLRPAAAALSPATSGRAPWGPTAWSLSGVAVGVGGRALLEGVDLAAAPGEVVIVTGANGSGKTTLLRTIAGLLAPLSGLVERRPGRVAYLPQEPGLLLHRQSVRAEVDQTLRWSRVDGPADDVLGILGLLPLAGRDPRDLSGGQRQRAALAVVLAGRPSLALLDEPTRGMDAAARVSLAGVLRRLADQGAAVVAATHDVGLARELRGRVVRIEDGALVPDDGAPRSGWAG